MLLEFTVYFARSLGDAEEKAKKIIRDYLGKHNGCEYTLNVLNVSGHATDLDYDTYVFNVEFQADINLKPLSVVSIKMGDAVECANRPYVVDALRLVG